MKNVCWCDFFFKLISHVHTFIGKTRVTNFEMKILTFTKGRYNHRKDKRLAIVFSFRQNNLFPLAGTLSDIDWFLTKIQSFMLTSNKKIKQHNTYTFEDCSITLCFKTYQSMVSKNSFSSTLSEALHHFAQRNATFHSDNCKPIILVHRYFFFPNFQPISLLPWN